MLIKNILKIDKIPQLWVICVVLIYGLLMAEFFNTLNNKMFYAQPNFSPNTIFTYIMTFNYAIMIVMSFAIWIVTSFLFHLFATLLSGNAQFKDFQKLTGLAYFVSAIFFLIAIFMIESVEIKQSNTSSLFKPDPTMIIISWLINIAGFAYYLVVIPITKYLYNINWLKSIGAIAIPMGSIYLLSQFFAKFIF